MGPPRPMPRRGARRGTRPASGRHPPRLNLPWPRWSGQFFGVITRRSRVVSEPVWEGVVHVFDLEGHPKATRAYAWSSPIEGSTKRRFFAVLHMGPTKSPVDAVRAAIVAEHKANAQ
jgi:hypothetical protein